MFSRTFVRASKSEGPRRRMRQERTEERRIALQNRWYVGGLAAIVASSLVFSGMSPASAEEVTTPDPAATTEATTTDTTSTDAAPPPPAEEPATPPPAAEEPAAPEATVAEETAPPAALAVPVAEPEIAALALPCAGWPVSGSPLAGFEIDGNLCLDGAGTKDWATVGGQPVADDGYDDATQFTQGSKESNWPWSSGQIGGDGVAPGKTDIGNVYSYTQTVGGHVYAYLGFERAVNNGSVSYHVELNQKPNTLGPTPDRSVNDLRLTIEQNGNNTISLVGADRWNGTAWVSLGNLSGFVGQVNQGQIENLAGDVLEPGEFAEMAIDLTVLFGNAGCSGNYGVLNIRSSSSPEDTSSLADWIKPVAVNVPSTCSTLTILKTDMGGTPLAGAKFSITPNPATGTGSTTGTTDANGKIVFSGNVQPGTYTVTETEAPAGYLLDSTPQQVTFGDNAESKTLTFKDPLGSGAWVKRAGDANGALLGGATFSLAATGGPAAAAPWAATFPKTVVDNGANDADPVAGQIKVVNLPIGTYSVTETAAPAGYVLDPSAKTFAVTQAAPNATISTPFVNIPYATVTLTKDWVNSFDGDKADLAIGGAATKTGTSTAPTDGPVISVSVAPGSSLNLSEVLNAQNRGLYTSVLSCVGASVSDNTGLTGSITVPAYPASANGVQCTFTNTAKTRIVKLQKQWVDGFQGDSAQLSLTGDADGAKSTATGVAGSQLDTVNVATATVRVGETVNFGEALTAPSGAAYGTTFSCTPTVAVTGSDKAYTLDRMPNADVVCTFTNTAQKATVTLKKQWVDAFEGDAAILGIAAPPAVDVIEAVAPEGDGTSPQIATLQVRIGEKVALGETLDDDNQGDYTSTWSCDDGTSGTGTQLGQITVTKSVVCTIVNTAKTIQVTVNKTWDNAFGGDTAQLGVNGTTETSTAGTAGQLIVNETDAPVVTETVRIGDPVNIAETLNTAGNRGSYTSSYVCTGAAASGQGTTIPEFEATSANVSCTFTNTAVKVGVLLKKNWIDALAGDKTSLSVTPESGPIATALSTMLANSPKDFLDDINVVGLQVRIGAVLPMKEVLTANGTYASSFSCSAGETTAVGVDGRAFTLKVTGAAICRFINVSQTAHLTVVKSWVNSQDGDSAALSVTGGATGAATSNTDGGTFTDLDHTISAEATIGQTVNVKEIVSVEHGDASDYTSTLVCTSGETVVYTGSAREGSFTMPGVPVTCTFTNTAELPSIALVKIVSGAPGIEDTNWQLIAAPQIGPAVTNLAGGDVVKTNVVAGVPFVLSEDLIGTFPGSNEFAAGLWSCLNEDGQVTLTDSTPGKADLRGLDKGENVVCTIVNSHVDQGFTVEKTATGSTQHEDGSWTVTYDIRVHNNSVIVPITYDLSDTLDAPADGVSYTGASWTGPTTGSFTLPSLTAQLADDEVAPPFNGDPDPEGSNDPVYTVSVNVEVSAIPTEPNPCDAEVTEGIGIVNTAYLTVGEVTKDDSACGTVHYDDVSILKTATNLPEPPEGEEPWAEVGDTFDYVLTVTNNGTRDAKGLVVTDPVPARLEVTAVDLPDGWQNDNGGALVGPGNTISVRMGPDTTLGAGESVDITVTVEFLPPDYPEGAEEPPTPIDSLVNEACVEAPLDQDPTNDCSENEIPVHEITAIVYTTCVGDAPLLGWTISKSGTLLDDPIDFLWTPDSLEPTTDPQEIAITQPGGTSTWSDLIDWPGTAFTPSGVSIDYPGWRPLVASDYGPNGGFINPQDGQEYAPADAGDFVFNGLILDPSELDYSWRLQSTVTFSVNPTLEFSVEYPPASPECFVARHSDVQIEKTASVEKTEPGKSFTYSLAVENMSDDSAAEGVVVTDTIPADIKITDVTWPGKGDANTFPNWESCAVAGQDGSGYGGTLTCVLFGPLQPQGANDSPSAAPTITLAATVNPASKSSSITNVAVVDYHTFGDPDDPGRDSDDAVVLLSALPATGGELPPLLVILGLLALLGGTAMLIVTRRRRGEAKATI